MDSDRVLQLLARLVAVPSLSGHEEKVCDIVAEHVESLGFVAERQEVYKTGYNVVTRIGDGGDVLFCGHLDVVPEYDMAEAFRPRVVGDKLYGRGACDMKGGVVSLLLLLESLRQMEPEPNASFAFVVDEEMYGRGAAELMRRGMRAEICVITEPTSNVICVGNASCMEFRLTASGKSGHGASRADGNAVKSLMRFYEIFERRVMTELDVRNSDFPMSPIINLGRFEGGYGGWVIPSKAFCEVLVHMHPSISYRDGLDIVRRLVKETAEELGAVVELTMLHGCDGFILPQTNQYLHKLKQAYSMETGQQPKTGLIESETDGNALYHKGGIPCIVYGPGDIAYAHSSQEHVSIKDVIECYRVLRRFINMVSGSRN
ncbi:MAG: M20/M25/M40 family metallo-hydrolase [Candidatus Caldarchaeum sp.]